MKCAAMQEGGNTPSTAAAVGSLLFYLRRRIIDGWTVFVLSASLPGAPIQHLSRGVSMLAAEKSAVRRAMRATLRALPEELREKESLAIAHRLLASATLRNSRRVGVYVSCERLQEVNTFSVLRHLLARGGPQVSCFVPLVGAAPREMHLLRIDSLSELVPNSMGILEPPATTASGEPREDAMAISSCPALDLIIVPGLAFDVQGRRLGRGGGYYDALLAQDAQRAAQRGERPALRVALAFDQQILTEGVPAEERDLRVDCILTPSGAQGPSQLL